MPSTTDPYAQRKPTFGGGLQQSYQLRSPMQYGEQPGGMYGDDERAPDYGQPQVMPQQYSPLQPTPYAGGQAYQAPNGSFQPFPVPPPAPPPPPKPGYETGHTAAIGTPIPGSETPLGAIGNDGKAATETTTAGMQNLIRDQILNMIGQPMPTANDPQLQPAMSAFNAAQNRSTARQVNQNAEAFGAAGLESSGARLAADRGAIEQQGLNEGTFASNAVLQELIARRDQVQKAMTLGSAHMDQDLARRLQQELATLNATVQRESIAQTGRLGDKDIDMRQKLGTAGNNISLLSLMQQGRQFNDSMGFNVANAEAMYNNDAVRKLLGIG
jgi:hypothetical protein